MRFAIFLAVLFLLPAYVVVLEWNYVHFQQPKLLAQCQARLNEAGLGALQVSLDHFDARLTGVCQSPDDRERARAVVEGLPGLRVRDEDHLVTVPAQLQSRLEDGVLRLEGWLPTETAKRLIAAMAVEFRPDLTVDTKGIRLLPLVEMGPGTELSGQEVPVVFATLLNSIRAPASLSINPGAEGIEVRGYLPSRSMCDSVVKEIEASAPGRRVEASRLKASPHLLAAPFIKGEGLVTFLRRFFATSAPGTFSIDARNGARLKAHATVGMESEWLRLLRPLVEASRVDMQITRVPSRYHLPGYQPVTLLNPAWLAVIRSQRIFFEAGGLTLAAEEEAKLEPVAYLLMEAGPAMRVVVAGYSDPLGEPGGESLRLRRAGLIRDRLLDYGVAPEAVQAEGFETVRPPGVLTEDQRRLGRSVEFLVP